MNFFMLRQDEIVVNLLSYLFSLTGFGPITCSPSFEQQLIAGVLTLLAILLGPIILQVLSVIFTMLLGGIFFILESLYAIVKKVVVVVGNPIKLFLLIIRPYNSQKNFTQKNLEHIFNRAENKEEIVGSLLEIDAYWKRKVEECGDNSKELEKKLKQRRREMLKQIFIIKANSIKTKLEDLFSNKKKKIDN